MCRDEAGRSRAACQEYQIEYQEIFLEFERIGRLRPELN